MNESGNPTVFAVSGPSGSGKTTLCGEALKRLAWLRASISHTTRPARPGEVNGRDYHFVDRGTFGEMIGRGEFLEWAEVHGHLYGSSKRNLEGLGAGQALLFEVDCRGARKIRQEVAGAALIFVMAPSLRDLLRRIQKRGEMSRDELLTRFRTARQEIREIGAFDFLLINDVFADTLAQLQAILTGQQHHREALAPFWLERWEREVPVLFREMGVPG